MVIFYGFGLVLWLRLVLPLRLGLVSQPSLINRKLRLRLVLRFGLAFWL